MNTQAPAQVAPKKPESRKRTGLVGVRLLPDEFVQLQREAARRSVSPAELLRQAYLGRTA